MINLACKLGRIHQLRDVSLDWSVNAFPTFPKRTAGDEAFPRVGADWHLWLVAQIQRGHVKRCCWPSCPSHSLSPLLSWFSISFFLPYLLLSFTVVSEYLWVYMHAHLETRGGLQVTPCPVILLLITLRWDLSLHLELPDFPFSDKLTGRSTSPQDPLVSSISSTSFRSSCDHVSLHMVDSGHLTSGPNACKARFLPYLFSPTKSDLELDVRRQL